MKQSRSQRKYYKSYKFQKKASIQQRIQYQNEQVDYSSMPLLSVCNDDEGIKFYIYRDFCNDSKNKVLYKKQGITKYHVSCDKFLKTTIEASYDEESLILVKNYLSKQNQVTYQQKIKQENLKYRDKKQFQPKNKNRYFEDQKQTQDENSSSQQSKVEKIIRCFRCNKVGHKRMMCLQSIKEKCILCLKDHHYSVCQNVLCQFCNNPIHTGKQCQVRTKCYKCQKNGHHKKDCGQVLMRKILLDQQNLKNDLKLTICIKCNQSGHFNCHKYDQGRLNIYQQDGVFN